MNIDLWRVFIVWPVLCALPLFLGFAHALKRLGLGRDDLLFPGVLLAVLGGVLIACLRLYFLERRRVRIVSQAPRLDDGAQVVAGGRLRAGTMPLRSPLDGAACGLYGWSIGIRVRDQAERTIGRGVALADATLDASSGSLPLQGIPDVQDVAWDHVQEPATLARLAQTLLEDDVIASGPNCATGIVLSSEPLPPADANERAGLEGGDGIRWASLLTGYLPTVPWDAIRARHASGDRDVAVRQLAECLHATQCRIYITALPIGADVTVVGRWNSVRGRLWVGQESRMGWLGILGIAVPMLAERGRRRMRRALMAAALLGVALIAVFAWSS